MKWYKHDTDATQDAKIRKLIMRHGPTGYAVYFHCLELIAGDVTSSRITFELEHDAEIIADNLKVQGTSAEAGIDQVNRIMKTIVELGLLEEIGGRIFCIKMAKRIDSSMTSNPRFRKALQEGHDSVMTQSCKKIEDRTDQKIEDRTDQKIEDPPLDNILNYWNSKPNLPKAGMVFNLPNPALCLDAIKGFGVDYIKETIDILDENKAEIGKYCPDFYSLLTKGKLGYWHDYKAEKNEPSNEISAQLKEILS